MKAVFGAMACLAVGACGGGPRSALLGQGRQLAVPLAAAFRQEATGDPTAASKAYLDVLDVAVQRAPDPWQLVVAQAALDALVWRSVPALDEVTTEAALVYRTKDGSLLGTGERADSSSIVSRLKASYTRGEGPFAAGLIARALLETAEHRGDAAEAARWREATGCAREATVIGPLAWTPVTGVKDADPLAAFDAKIEAAYAAPGAFGGKHAPVLVRGRGCSIELSAPGSLPGVRDVVVDVEVKRAQTIGIALRAHGAALLRAGGRVVLERPYELGEDEAARFVAVDAPEGTLRLVARVGMDEDGESLELDVWDAKGQPLSTHAPHVGEGANGRVTKETPILYPDAKTDPERLAVAVGALAAGDGRTAERVVEAEATRANPAPELALAYARAVETARDLSLVHRAERARAAYEKVLDVWPAAWEGVLAHAVLAGVRRGQGDARIETLRDLDAHRKNAAGFALPLLDAFDAAISGKDQLFDRAHEAFERAKKELSGTSLLVDVGRVAFERTGADRAAYDCSVEAPHHRGSLLCYDALHAKGDLRATEGELQRLRALRGGQDLFLPLSMRDALARGDAEGAKRALHDMLPGEVTLSAVYGVANFDPSRAGVAPETRDRLMAVMPTARDAPASFPSLVRTMGDDPAAEFAGVAERLRDEGRAHPILAAAATAVLAHDERYAVEASGVTHAVMFDVRRVSGTTDVEENAQAAPPELIGRGVLRVLRRRILKRDGRVLEPDRAPHASQSHSDLSQLEAGDIVEAVYEGWAVPGETGNLGIDTPDLLPDRTAVHAATIVLRLPDSVKGSLWSHPLLGKATETKERGHRVLSWKLSDVAARRIEEGTPKMDRNVAVSFSTLEWGEMARGLREELASLDEHDPAIGRFAREAVGIPANRASTEARPRDAATRRASIEAVVSAVGKSVKEASPAVLSDIGVDHTSGPQATTARTILANHEGSRSWLVVRLLRELGIQAEVVVAENEPYSADPSFPPHAGRFMHPLVITHDDGCHGSPAAPCAERVQSLPDVWIDADVQGPPLPAGRISPELRGRNALHADGSIAPVPAFGNGDERDEVDLRLTVDPKGDAKGTFTIILRGRDAQELAEALLRIVGDERQRALRGVALAWVPFANVDDVQLSSSEGSWQIAVRAELSIPAYAQVEGIAAKRTWVLPGIDPLHIVFPRGVASTLGATYASEGARESALAVSRAVQYHAHRRVELPQGTSLVRMPGPFEVKTASLEASRRIAVSGTVLEDDFVLGVPTGTVAADAYGSFVTNAHKTDDAFLASTRVKPDK